MRCCWTSHPTAGHTRTSQAPYVWQRQATYASKCYMSPALCTGLTRQPCSARYKRTPRGIA